MLNMEKPPKITLSNVSKTIKVRQSSRFSQKKAKIILRNISLVIQPNDVLIITGKNGVGKSTLINLIAAVDEPTGGYIEIDEMNLSQQKEEFKAYYRNKVIGFITQKPSIIDTLSLVENISLPLLFNPHLTAAQREQSTQDALRQFDAEQLQDQPFGSLSVGEQRRIAIARALINDPWVILADEATANLDSSYKRIIYELLKAEYVRGKTLIIVTHDEGLWAEYFPSTAIRNIDLSGGDTNDHI